MDKQLTQHELIVLRAICAAGGQYQSLFRLAIALNMRYETCWKCAVSLACRGMVQAERSKTGRGRGYWLRIACLVNKQGLCLCDRYEVSSQPTARIPAYSNKTRMPDAERYAERVQ